MAKRVALPTFDPAKIDASLKSFKEQSNKTGKKILQLQQKSRLSKSDTLNSHHTFLWVSEWKRLQDMEKSLLDDFLPSLSHECCTDNLESGLRNNWIAVWNNSLSRNERSAFISSLQCHLETCLSQLQDEESSIQDELDEIDLDSGENSIWNETFQLLENPIIDHSFFQSIWDTLKRMDAMYQETIESITIDLRSLSTQVQTGKHCHLLKLAEEFHMNSYINTSQREDFSYRCQMELGISGNDLDSWLKCYRDQKLCLLRLQCCKEDWARHRNEFIKDMAKQLELLYQNYLENVDRDLATRDLDKKRIESAQLLSLWHTKKLSDLRAKWCQDQESLAIQREKQARKTTREKNRRQMIAKKIESYTLERQQIQKQERQIQKRQDLEKLRHKQAQSRKDIERVNFRNAQIQAKKEAEALKNLELRNEEEKRERDLERLRSTVRPQHIERDPNRVLQPTASHLSAIDDNGSFSRSYGISLRPLEKQYDPHSFTSSQLMSDKRFLVATALYEINALHSDYGRQLLASIEPAKSMAPHLQQTTMEK